MATARSGTPGPPNPEPPTPAGLRRPRSLPEQPGGPLPPPRRLSPLTPRPHRDLPTPGTPPTSRTPPTPGTPGTPPALLAAAADLRVLTRRCPAGERGAAWPGPPRLPPLVAALTRRTGATERPQPLRSPPPPPRALPPPPRPPGLCPSVAPVPPPPGRGFPDAVTLRPHPALCGDTGDTAAHGAPEPLSLRAIYRELCRALPAERLRFHGDPAVEPAAAPVDLAAPEPQVAPRPHRDPPSGLFARYLRYVAATGSDFLGATFHVPGAAAATAEQREPAPVSPTAQPSQEGLWHPVQPEPLELQPLQRRLNRLWTALSVPAGDRAAMALKYGSGAALARLPAALEAWEAAAAAVVRRERLLAQLERLESGGTAGSIAERRRRRCERELRRSEAPVRRALRRLRGGFGDAVTLRGRPYGDKMRRDAVEMRYALAQRRRAAAILGGRAPRDPPPGDADGE